MTPKVSVVVPVYNAEPYLARCVDSILGQTLSDIEVVLVNDGSTDASGAMIDVYAARDPRVKAIHTENRGPANAQHTGILASHGKYVTVYDNDDYAPLDALERLCERAEATGADLVEGYYWERLSDLSEFVLIRDRFECETNEPFAMLKHLLSGDRKGGPLWALLIRRELYTEHVREYPLSYYFQDFVAMVQLFYHTRKMVRLHHPVYYYAKREDSLSSRWRDWTRKRSDESRTITHWTLDYLEQKPDKALFADALAYYALFRTALWQMTNYTEGLGSDLSDLKARIFRDYYPNRTARRRMRREWPKQFVFLAAERRAGWRLVRNVLWGTPWMSKTLRTIRKIWRKIK